MSESTYSLVNSSTKCSDKKHLARRMYFDGYGTLRYENVEALHHPEDELKTVIEYEQKYIGAQETVYIIHLGWLADWITFVETGSRIPGQITNDKLISQRDTVKRAALYNVHWRPVNRKVWTYLMDLYGGGPAISIRNFSKPLHGVDAIQQYMATRDLSRDAHVFWSIAFPTPEIEETASPHSTEIVSTCSCFAWRTKPDQYFLQEKDFLTDNPLRFNHSSLHPHVNASILYGQGITAEVKAFPILAELKALDDEIQKQRQQLRDTYTEQQQSWMNYCTLDTKKKIDTQVQMLAIRCKENCSRALELYRRKIRCHDAILIQYAAMRIQHSYRGLICRRERAIYTKQRFVAATKIAVIWRVGSVRRGHTITKLEKQRRLEGRAAVLIQASWRCKLAIQKRRRLRRPFYMHLLRASELSGKHHTGDIFVIVSAHELEQKMPRQSRRGSSLSNILGLSGTVNSFTRRSSLTDMLGLSETDLAVGEQVTVYHSKHGGVNQSSVKMNPPIFFNDVICMSGCNGFSTIVFTVLGKNNKGSGIHPCYGQTSQCIKHMELWSDTTSLQKKLKLGAVEFPIFDGKGKQIHLETKEKSMGEIWVDFIPNPTCSSISSYCNRFISSGKRASFVGKRASKWSPTWGVLTVTDGLQFYASSSHLSKNEEDGYFQIDSRKIIGSKILDQFESRSFVLEIKGASTDGKATSIYLHFDDCDEAVQWQLKLRVMNSRVNGDSGERPRVEDNSGEHQRVIDSGWRSQNFSEDTSL